MESLLLWGVVGLAATAILIVATSVKRRSAVPETLSPQTPVRGVAGHCINEKTLEDQVRVHLTECLALPIDQAFAELPIESLVELCCQTIRLATSGGWEETVPLPEGMTFRGMSEAPVHALVGEFQLVGWLRGSLDDKPSST